MNSDKKENKIKDSAGFTLIELLVVITLIGVLAGVLLNVLNVSRQRQVASDGVIQANLNQLSSGVNVYLAAEGSLPIDSNGDGNPLNDGSTLSNYLQVWPIDTTYTYVRDAANNLFCISAPMATNTSQSFKFVSRYVTGMPQGCVSKVVKNCTSSCSVSSTSLAGCIQLTGAACF